VHNVISSYSIILQIVWGAYSTPQLVERGWLRLPTISPRCQPFSKAIWALPLTPTSLVNFSQFLL